jgi:hypothetical protein
MFTDPGKRQYVIFAFILATLFGGLLSFFFADLLEGPLISGFPVSITELTGVSKFLAQSFNTIVLGILLTIPAYYLLSWLNRKSGGGGF